MAEISRYDDIIDSRDVIERISELETQRDEGNDYGDDESEELETLRAFAAEGADSCADWEHGETLIRDSHFTTYAQELADDIGAIDANASWPLSHIDWEAAARELQADYTELTFRGVSYWAR